MAFERDTAINDGNSAVESKSAMEEVQFHSSPDPDMEKGTLRHNESDHHNNRGKASNSLHKLNPWKSVNKNDPQINQPNTVSDKQYRPNWPHSPAECGHRMLLYYKYINPWIRIVVIGIPLLYLYSVLLSIATYRNARWRSETHDYPRPSIIHPIIDNSLSPAFEPFIMPDLLFDVISPAKYPSSGFDSWQSFVDATAALFTVAFIVACICRRDMIRFAEYAGFQLEFFLIMIFTKILTNYPVSSGVTSSCRKGSDNSFNGWVASNFSFDYCGDQMFSGHTLNTVLPLIMLKRMLWDYLGWNFSYSADKQAYLDQKEMQHIPQINADNVTNTNNPKINSSTSCFFYNPIALYSTPLWVQRHRHSVWLVVCFLRALAWFWTGLFVYGLLHIRQHYTADITVAIIVCCLLTSNTKIAHWNVRWFYRPNYWNYRETGVIPATKLTEFLNEEQLNYDIRVRKTGKGGII
jgi:hypothetical protein